MIENPVFVVYTASLFLSLIAIASAFRWRSVWSRLIAAALTIPISFYFAGYPAVFFISLIFPLLVYRGLYLAHSGRHFRGLLYCGPYIVLDVLLIFFTFIFEPLQLKASYILTSNT